MLIYVTQSSESIIIMLLFILIYFSNIKKIKNYKILFDKLYPGGGKIF